MLPILKIFRVKKLYEEFEEELSFLAYSQIGYGGGGGGHFLDVRLTC